MQKFKFFTLAIIAMLSVNLWSADLKVGDYLIKETFKGGVNSTTFSAKTYGTTYSSITWSTGNSGDASSISYASENAGFYNPTQVPANMTANHVWLNKNTAGYIQINNIPLHNVTKFKAHWASNNANATFYFKYKFNGESSWSDGGYQKAKSADNQGTEITVPSGKTSVSIQFSRENNGENNRMDDLKLEVLEVASAATPTITKTANLTNFTYEEGSGPSAAQSFTVGGSNLTANIIVTAPTNFEVSKSSGSGYASSVTLTQSSGTVSNTTIYVRMKSGLSQGTSKGGNISLTSTGATTQTIAVTGTVTAPAVHYIVTLLNNGQPVNKGGFDTNGQKDYVSGTQLGTLPTLTTSDACDATSVTFMGWTTEQITAKRSTAPTFVDASTTVNAAMTLRAVWARAE